MVGVILEVSKREEEGVEVNHDELLSLIKLAASLDNDGFSWEALRAVVELAKAELEKPYDEDKEFFAYEIDGGESKWAYQGGLRDSMNRVIQAIEKELK